MNLRKLASKPNLKLAWRRITTGGNYQYKRLYRDLYYVYEVALDANLRDLRQRILGGSFEPQHPDRIYVPKTSGLHRPLALLNLEDQVVLQAFANLAVERVQQRRMPLQLKVIFSNILEKPNSIFFFRQWQKTYGAFQRRIRKHYQGGMQWVGDFDLAAFYDTISHELLLRTLYPRTNNEDLHWISSCLQTWSSDRPVSGHNHGLPQGPIASDFLAECFLLPIDLALYDLCGYTRYVDDVRLFGTTEDEVRGSLIKLELHCRERGLIPQTGKFAIKRARSVQDAMGMLPSIPDPQHEAGGERIDKNKTRQLFLSALAGKPYRVADKTRLRYILYRADPEGDLLRFVLLLIPRHPEHTDAFFTYLGRFGYRKPIERLCLELIEHNPYPYVRGEAWHILAHYLREKRSLIASNPKNVTAKARKITRQRMRENFAERWGACHFLCVLGDTTGARHSASLKFQPPLLQSFLAPVLPNAVFTSGRVLEAYLRRETPEPGLSVCAALNERSLTPWKFGVQVKELPSQVANTLRELGVVSAPSPRIDPIAEIIEARYQVTRGKSWRRLLSGEYVHAVALLKLAEATFDSGRSHWLMYQNSFNQTIFIALQIHLNATGHAAACKTRDKIGQLIDFGVTLEDKQSFSKNCPDIANCFREMNARRNHLPPVHPYEKKKVVRAFHLKTQERNKFVGELRFAYTDFTGLMP